MISNLSDDKSLFKLYKARIEDGFHILNHYHSPKIKFQNILAEGIITNNIDKSLLSMSVKRGFETIKLQGKTKQSRKVIEFVDYFSTEDQITNYLYNKYKSKSTFLGRIIGYQIPLIIGDNEGFGPIDLIALKNNRIIFFEAKVSDNQKEIIVKAAIELQTFVRIVETNEDVKENITKFILTSNCYSGINEESLKQNFKNIEKYILIYNRNKKKKGKAQNIYTQYKNLEKNPKILKFLENLKIGIKIIDYEKW